MSKAALEDPLIGSAWSRRETVAGFVASGPNETLLQFARRQSQCGTHVRALDIGCGAGRNAIPLARQGWDVLGTDLSLPMLEAAVARGDRDGVRDRTCFALAPMDRLPVADRSCDLVIAHGIWNLAPSSATFRRAVREAARVAKDGAALFVFTFSRNTLGPGATPVPGDTFVFTDFSGEPQCFLTEAELLSELAAAGFAPDPSVPLRELNRPARGQVRGGPPVIFEAGFRRTRLI
jgi:SAM-dependent methyltransferase